MLASVLWCSGSAECLKEALRDRDVELRLDVLSATFSVLLFSATVEVLEEPTLETIDKACSDDNEFSLGDSLSWVLWSI